MVEETEPTASWIRTTNAMRTLMQQFRVETEALLAEKNSEKDLPAV